MRTLVIVVLLCLTSFPIGCPACGTYGILDLESLQQQLQSSPENLADLVAHYRALGPNAVNQLVDFRDQLSQVDPSDSTIPALEALIDRVAAQRYASHSRLYWYTDFATARRVAAAAGKPILSLRLLGNLDEEFSCANSRFFRTTLYANERISDLLREQFVLHWQSVRPVPKVSVDFGDGRRLQRTVTGNSIHYVVSADGEILEALPGLYAPPAFQAWLARCLELNGQIAAAATPADKQHLLKSYHAGRSKQILSQWHDDLSSAGGLPQPRKGSRVGRPTSETLQAQTTEMMWELFAAAENRVATSALDAASIRLIRSENPTAGDAQRFAVSKSVAEDPIFRMVRNLERTIRVDTIRNEYLLHRPLHDRLAAAEIDSASLNTSALAEQLNSLNAWVYAALFRSPLHDPWLGLVPADAYNALQDGGVLGSGSVALSEDPS